MTEPAALLHVAVDALHLAALLRSRPDLRAAPVVVAAPGQRAVVLCAGPRERARGLLPGTPMSRARRLYPDLVVLPPDPVAAEEAWEDVLAVLATTTPLVEPVARGRALLDVTGARRLLGPPPVVAALVRARVLERTAMVCAVGLAATRTVAALACAAAAPGGQLAVVGPQVPGFMAHLPLSALPGVGAVTAGRLARLGLRTVADLGPVDDGVLTRALGARDAARLRALAAGCDPLPGGGRGWSSTDNRNQRRTEHTWVGGEHTFARDVVDEGAVLRAVLSLCVRAAAALRARGSAGRTVVLTVRLADRTALTRSVDLDEPADLTRPLRAGAVAAWARLGLQRARVRGVGVRVQALVPATGAHHQMELGEREVGWAQGERAVDAAVARFGAGAVGPASLLVLGGGVSGARVPGGGVPGGREARAGAQTLRSTATTRPRISARSPSMGW